MAEDDDDRPPTLEYAGPDTRPTPPRIVDDLIYNLMVVAFGVAGVAVLVFGLATSRTGTVDGSVLCCAVLLRPAGTGRHSLPGVRGQGGV